MLLPLKKRTSTGICLNRDAILTKYVCYVCCEANLFFGSLNNFYVTSNLFTAQLNFPPKFKIVEIVCHCRCFLVRTHDVKADVRVL